MAAIGALLALGLVSWQRRARFLAGVCSLIALVFAGALTARLHAPGPAPQLDVEGREIVILGGCVVEPPAISGERERFLLELAPGARAQVTLYTKKEGEALPALRYGQNYRDWTRACASRAITAIREHSITRTTWRARKFTGRRRARRRQCAFCRRAADRGSRKRPWICAPRCCARTEELYRGKPIRRA